MAEVLGVVASGIAVGQLAGLVTKSIFKLKDYWNQVHEASDDVKHLLREIDSLHLILCHIQEDQAKRSNGESHADNVCLRQSLELCREGAEELRETADELAKKVDGKKGWKKKVGSVKVVLKKEDVKKLKKRMKNSIRLLSLSYQLHTNAMIQLQPDLIVTRMISHIESHTVNHPSKKGLETLVGAGEAGEAPKSSIQRQYDIWICSPSWLSYLFGHLSYQQHTRLHRGRDVDDITAIYKLPDFIANKVLNIQGNNALSGWKLNIRIYRIIPYTNPFFSAVSSGDMVTVQRLLADKEYFISDRAYLFEETALHRAVRAGNVEMCKLLLREGADSIARSRSNVTPLHEALWSGGVNTFRGGGSSDINRLLLSAGGVDILIDDPTILRHYLGSVKNLQYLYEEAGPITKSGPLFSAQTRMTFAAKATWANWPNVPFLVEYWLNLGYIENGELRNWVDSCGQTLLHMIARSFAQINSIDDEIYPKLDESFSPESKRQMRLTKSYRHLWQPLIHRLISAGCSPSEMNQEGHTVFSAIANEMLWYYTTGGAQLSDVKDTLRVWLEILVQYGIDLLQYSEEETNSSLINKSWACQCATPLGFPSGGVHQCNKQHVFYRKYPKTQRHDNYYPRGELIFSFLPGPRPEDWIFTIFAPAKAYARDFWHMVEGDKGNSSYHPPHYEECLGETWSENEYSDGKSSDDGDCFGEEEGSSLHTPAVPGSWSAEFDE
ncbi:hypothetical protein VTL71DRAFT_12956 [Oculimacula yallundae]|uniref:Uncharacterized protein n=1 Tax=Oculimacula yallundae TaxID=86028 RepID=A0ABR4CQR5_9HELO